MTGQYFKYGKTEIDYLKSRDKKLAAAIDKIGYIKREVTPDIFTALVNSITGQQISNKALVTILKRLHDKFSPITPENLSRIDVQEIQLCGISMRKASYISEMAKAVAGGEVDLSKLNSMSDKEVCDYLCKLKGIGSWTAEMIMLFSMQRSDILSAKDFVILKGMRALYGHKEITPALFEKYRSRYSPYGSVASLYLWQIAVMKP